MDLKEQPTTDFAVIKENGNPPPQTYEKFYVRMITDSHEKYLDVNSGREILRTACQDVFAATAKNFMQ
jgi:hypothetical protein